MRILMWFREDLRLRDNPALYQAAKSSKEGVIAVYFITLKLWRKKGYGKNKIDFLLRNVKLLAQDLAKRNITLLIKTVNSYSDIQHTLLKFAQDYHLDALYFNERFDDQLDKKNEFKIIKLFNKHRKEVHVFNDDIILPYGAVLNQKQQFYTVFTPFKKKWLRIFVKQNNLKVLGLPRKQNKMIAKTESTIDWTLKVNDSIKTLWPAGEKEANKRLKRFMKKAIYHYDVSRDYPALDATSRLSPYLACGIISPRLCLQAALKANQGQINKGNKGVLTWISELIWRDFYKHLTYAFPLILEGKPFKAYTTKIKWRYDKKQFNQWKNGKTGFPIVDAAMNQLNQTGWMHNRLRMISASFLTKLLLIDWRWGEKYFADQLIDYDFAANNGGWQWSASTGADSVPYFRIFNPSLQQKRFDPKEIFIQSQNLQEIKKQSPIIDYKKARTRALKHFKGVKS